VEGLKGQVSKYSGNSRKDKEYIYLDEMLTRNLLKLDDIDTEGKDDVRQARKDAIRTIQRCISCLEGKAPLPEENKGSAAEENEGPAIKETAMDIGTEECQANGTEGSVPMDAAPAEGAMEVPPVESASEISVAKADEGTNAEAKNAAQAASEQTHQKVDEAGSVEPVVEEQKMEVAQIGTSTEVKPGVTGEVNKHVPMEVDEQHKRNVEKPQPVSKPIESKKYKVCGKNIAHVKNNSAPSEKTNMPAGGVLDKVPVTEDTGSKVDTTGEVQLASQPQLEKTS
jgi:hypothetical protein